MEMTAQNHKNSLLPTYSSTFASLIFSKIIEIYRTGLLGLFCIESLRHVVVKKWFWVSGFTIETCVGGEEVFRHSTETHEMTLNVVLAPLAYWSAVLQNAFNTDLMCLSDILTHRL